MAWQNTALGTVTKILSFWGEDFFPLLASFPTFSSFSRKPCPAKHCCICRRVGERWGEPFCGRLSVGKGKLMGSIVPGQHHQTAPGIPVQVNEVQNHTELLPQPYSVSGSEGLWQLSKCHFHLAAQFKIELHLLRHLGHRVPKSLGQTTRPQVISRASHFNNFICFPCHIPALLQTKEPFKARAPPPLPLLGHRWDERKI